MEKNSKAENGKVSFKAEAGTIQSVLLLAPGLELEPAPAPEPAPATLEHGGLAPLGHSPASS
jgi:hypothetical protein